VDAITNQWAPYATIDDDAGTDKSMWAIALNAAGDHLVATTTDGQIVVWNVISKDTPPKNVRCYETASAGNGTMGMAVDLSKDGLWTASGHQNGTVYVFNNETTRLAYSLTGTGPSNTELILQCFFYSC
jgi:superkiller protein 8